jgi:hypothetical protein
MMPLFDDVARTDARSTHSETSFSFLNRVAGPFWERTRSTMEDWFSRLPDESKADVRGRVRSGDDAQFAAAYWELHVHETLACEGFTMTAHPELPETRARPDFLAERDDVAMYIEATVVGPSTSAAASERRLNTIYDSLDQLPSPNFFLWLQVNEEGPNSPSARGLRADLRRWLGTLDPDDPALQLERVGFDALPVHTWKASGWSIDFRPIAKSAEARGRPGVRPLGVFGPAQATAVDDVGEVRSDLRQKAGSYGQPGKPFVIAVLVESPFFDPKYTMSGALFGREAVHWNPETLASQAIRMPDGLWMGPGGPRNTRVSAVLVARRVRPWHPTANEPVVWHNPWSALPLADIFPWEAVTVDLDTGTLERREARKRAHEVLRLPEGWPGPEDPLPDTE